MKEGMTISREVQRQRDNFDIINADAKAAESTGERIARRFSEDKRHLTNAEQRRLAGMIDEIVAQAVAK